MSAEDDGPAAVMRDLRLITDKAQEQENWQAALKAIELRGRHFGLWDKKGGSDLASSEDVLQRYKAARERAQKAAAEHESPNVVPLRSE